MEKSNTPTTRHSVSCDTYDTTLSGQLHETENKEQKLHLKIKNEEGVQLGVSLYQEDVEMLASFLNAVSMFARARKQ